MRARDKYVKVFGRINSLAHHVSWSTGVSNMLEWLTWSTDDVLGITKTQYWKCVVGWSHEEPIRHSTLEEKQAYVKEKLDAALTASERLDRYARPAYSIASPREVLRRVKFFSEDYLNKEFDIFWTLVSDKYLDRYYSQFTAIKGNGRWYTHGNSGLFACSTDISEMQMDNLTYSPSEGLLVANEIKLGGRKNPDQILKYALMFKRLRDRKFIDQDSRFLLLFIESEEQPHSWADLIEVEIKHCEKSTKPSLKALPRPEVIALAKAAEYASTSWRAMMTFNTVYMDNLDRTNQQVEHKLLWGFNETLAAKKFMQKAAPQDGSTDHLGHTA